MESILKSIKTKKIPINPAVVISNKSDAKGLRIAKKMGINVEVIDLRTVRPIDYATVIASVKKTNRMVFVEEAWPLASISTEVSFKVQREAFDYLDAPIIRITSADVPLPYASTLIQEALPNAERVIKAVKEVLYLNK